MPRALDSPVMPCARRQELAAPIPFQVFVNEQLRIGVRHLWIGVTPVIIRRRLHRLSRWRLRGCDSRTGRIATQRRAVGLAADGSREKEQGKAEMPNHWDASWRLSRRPEHARVIRGSIGYESTSTRQSCVVSFGANLVKGTTPVSGKAGQSLLTTSAT